MDDNHLSNITKLKKKKEKKKKKCTKHNYTLFRLLFLHIFLEYIQINLTMLHNSPRVVLDFYITKIKEPLHNESLVHENNQMPI
jgi:hypothetical protein